MKISSQPLLTLQRNQPTAPTPVATPDVAAAEVSDHFSPDPLAQVAKVGAVGLTAGGLVGLVAGSLCGHPVAGAALTAVLGTTLGTARELSRQHTQRVVVQATQEMRSENAKLRDELTRLREEVPAQVAINLDQNQLTIKNIRTPEFAVDNLQVRMPQLGALTQDMLKVSTFVNPDNKLQLPSLETLQGSPIEVVGGHLKVTQKTVNQVARQIETPGIANLQIELGDRGHFALKGEKEGLINLPFQLQGRIARENDQQVRFALDKTTVLGFLPVPKLMTNIFASLASHTLQELKVEQKNGDYLFNASAFMPGSVEMGLKGVTTEEGSLVLDLGPAPKPSAK